jgi:NADPH:quinone reductase-like Zn-dependent oxidoreductase
MSRRSIRNRDAASASVNPIDWKRLTGVMSGGQPLASPEYLGNDAAGVVDEVGERVSEVSVGDDVFGRGQGTQAESAVLGASAGKPPSVGWAVAAAAGVADETAERGLRLLGTNAGDTIFVDGGAGSVGAVAVQMAVARGARVIASASEANGDGTVPGLSRGRDCAGQAVTWRRPRLSHARPGRQARPGPAPVPFRIRG